VVDRKMSEAVGKEGGNSVDEEEGRGLSEGGGGGDGSTVAE
jgi:hypothetical protein